MMNRSKSSFFTIYLTLVTAFLLVFAASPTQAAITWSGDISPSDPNTWTSNTVGFIGKLSVGTITVDDTSVLLSSSSYVGYEYGSSGSITVTGSGSKWTNSVVFYVGYHGSGVLTVSDGGQVSSSGFGYLGINSGSTGSVTVTGSGSKWTNSGNLYVGYNGSGVLTVSDGGTVVISQSIYASLSSLMGNGTISASGCVLDADLVFDAAHGLQNSLNFGSSGTLSITQSASNVLGVGYKGKGTLRIAEGVTVASSIGYLGYFSGSVGTATVIGSGSKWTISSDFFVGRNGSGALTVSDGGTVVISKSIYTSLSSLMGNGTISANGGVLDADLVFDAAHGSQYSLNFGSSGTLSVTQSASSSLGVGFKGTGTLRIAEGVTVASSTGNLGYISGSMGTATVTGSGSKWTNSSTLYVGNSGTGTLAIEAGGQVSNTWGYLGYDSGSTGSVTVNGSSSNWSNSNSLYVGFSGTGNLAIAAGGQVSNTSGYLGKNSGSSGSVTVTGSGSKWINSSSLDIVSGTLAIEAGGQVSNTWGYLGNSFGSTGTATVTGPGSKWTNSSVLFIGYSGTSTGTLAIEAGGQVSNSTCYLGYGSGSTGSVTVNGSSSNWSNSNTLYVGFSGKATLAITAGGQVSNTDGFLGYYSGYTGSVTITGSGSKWTNRSQLYVGYKGTGTLTIKDGGQVSNTDGFLGLYSGSTGLVTVTGSGSKWTNSGGLYVGYDGTGTLNIGSGIAGDGVVVAKSVTLARVSYATGTCNLNGGTLQVGSIAKGFGTTSFNWIDGTIQNYDANTDLTINSTYTLTLKLAATGTHAFYIDAGRTGTVAAILSDATSAGTLAKIGDGVLVLSADNTYTGTTTIDGGQLKLVVGGDIAFSSEIKNNAGFLIADGNHTVQKITGTGTTQVLTGSLTVSSIVQDTLTIGSTTTSVVPEPSSLILLAISTLAALAWCRTRIG